MKPTVSVIVVFALGLGAFLFFSPSRKAETVVQAQAPLVNSLVRLPRKTPVASAVLPTETTAEPRFTISPACRAQWKALNDLDLQQLLESKEMFQGTETLQSQCKALPKAFEGPTLLMKQSCGKPPGENATPEMRAAQQQVCYQSLVIYRAMIADWDSGTLSAAEIKDARLASDKLIANLFKDPADALPYAERLLELEPGFAPAAKMAAVLQMVSVDMKKPGSSVEKIMDAMERAERMEPTDSAFYNKMRDTLAMNSAPNDEKRVEAALKVAEMHPGTAQADYLTSYAAFKQGRYDEADRLITAALKADPKNPDYQETQKELRDLRAKNTPDLSAQTIYTHSYGMDLNSLIP